MGIFDRFRRRGRESAEAAPPVPENGGQDGEGAGAAEAAGAVEAPEKTPADGEAVEIPKQTAAAQAADSEAGEEAARP